MTMPDERLRAINWGGELLEQITLDDALPASLISAAKRIAMTYPAPQTLDEWLQSGAAGLRPEWTTALFGALDLFNEIRLSAHGSARTRSDLRCTLRHFPDKMTTRTMAQMPTLHEWLQRPEKK